MDPGELSIHLKKSLTKTATWALPCCFFCDRL